MNKNILKKGIAIGLLLGVVFGGVYFFKHYKNPTTPQTQSGVKFGNVYGSDLLLYYTLDSNNTVNNVADSSGNAQNGWIVGGVATSSRAAPMAQSLYCNTSTSIFRTPFDGSTLTKATVSFWFKPTATINSGSGEKDFMWINDSANRTTEYTPLFINGSGGADGKMQLDVKLDAQGDQTTETNTTSWTGGKWYHFVATWGDAGVLLYTNGQADGGNAGNTRSTNSMIDPDNSMNITFCQGHFGANPGSGNDVQMDDIRVYNRNLSAAEVQTLYYQGMSNHQNGAF